MNLIYGHVSVRPGKFLKDNLTHRDVSEGSRRKIVAERFILGRLVKFYNDGFRSIQGVELDDQEIHDSQLLRFAHASILIGEPVGHKNTLWVDASGYGLGNMLFYGTLTNSKSVGTGDTFKFTAGNLSVTFA